MPTDVRWPFPACHSTSRSWALASKLTLGGVGVVSKIWAEWLNRTTVYNREALYKAVEERPANQPLVTISNHHSCIDEPVLWGVLKWRHLVTKNELMRWTLGASDVCFEKEWHAKFFSLGRVVPVVRGEGVYQKSMDFILEKLNAGSWVHMFPEGRVNATHEFIRLKWGVGRLIADCKVTPIVLPLWHMGMDDVLPNKSPYIPLVGKKVTLVIGRQLEFSEMLSKLRPTKTPMEIRKEITDQIQDEFRKLKEQTESFHLLTTAV